MTSRIPKYEFDAKLSVEEAQRRLKETKEAYNQIRGRYSGPISRFRRTLREDDKDTLVTCILNSLPLTSPLVSQKHKELYAKALELSMQTMSFASRFKNSGIEAIRGRR